MKKQEYAAYRRRQITRKQSRVILMQWLVILLLLFATGFLAVTLKTVMAAEPDSTSVTELTESQFYEPLPEPNPCPITDDEIIILAKVLYQECNGLSRRGEQYGVSYTARQAAVAWCALNRLDHAGFPDTLKEVLTYPAAFAYNENAPVTDELLWLAEDVVNRWWDEKQGEDNVGRVLPKSYLFFYGDGKENHFRDAYKAPYTIWDWSLPDPYQY